MLNVIMSRMYVFQYFYLFELHKIQDNAQSTQIDRQLAACGLSPAH